MIIIIVGTNRDYSKSRVVAEHYAQLVNKHGEEAQILDLNKLPQDFVFSALYQNSGKNNQFNEFIRIVNSADKFVFIVPEYNGSYPGVLKAFIDGLDYPSSFAHKKAALVGISSGAMGGALALSHLTDVLNYLNMHVYAMKPRIQRINNSLRDGQIIDTDMMNLIEKQVKGFLEF